MPDAISTFVDFYKNLSFSQIEHLGDIYTDDVVFQDPLHAIQGIGALKQYFINLMENVESLHFNILQTSSFEQKATVEWVMTFTHPKFNSGKQVSVHGVSILLYDDKIFSHRDYFDLGEMLYEQLPIIGRLIRWIKAKV